MKLKTKLYHLFILLTIIFFVTTILKTYDNKVVSVISDNKNYYSDVTKSLLNLNTYAMSGTVTYISNEEKNTYNMLQYGKKDGTYRIEILDDDNSKVTTIFDTDTIYQYNDDMKGVVNVSTTEDSERSEIFITKFVENYETSQNVSVMVSNINNSACTVLEADIPGNHYYFASEKLYIDNETLLPKKLVIYDEDNLERIVVEYEQFIPNPTLDEEIFSVNGK